MSTDREAFTRLQKLLGSEMNAFELQSLILRASTHVCKIIGDPAAANTLRQVVSLYEEHEKNPRRHCLHCHKPIDRGFEVPAAPAGFAHRACEEANPPRM